MISKAVSKGYDAGYKIGSFDAPRPENPYKSMKQFLAWDHGFKNGVQQRIGENNA